MQPRFVFLLVVSGFLSATCFAQVPYKVGDEVEVYFSDEWKSGTVKEIENRRGIYCEYEYFTGRTREGWFTPNQVRRLYEKDAMSRGRLWQDAEGKFSVVAAVLRVDKETVILRTEANKTITVPIEKLAPTDRAFIKRLESETGGNIAVGAHRADVLDFDLSTAVDILPSAQSDATNSPLEADPLRSSLQLSEGGSAFEVGDFVDRIGAIIPLGGPDQWLLTSMESGRSDESRKLPTRLMWISIKQKKVAQMHPLPPGLQLKDYNPPSKLALTYDPHATQPVLSLWKSEPSEKKAELLFSWHGSNLTKQSNRGDESWARFVNDQIIVFRDSSRQVVAWDIRDRKAVWTTVQESAQEHGPELTPGNRYLLLPELGRLRVIEPVAGQELASLKIDGEIKSLSVDDDGHNVIVMLDNKLVAIDLLDPDNQRAVDIGFMGLQATSTVKWLDKDVVCLSTSDKEMLLFSLDRGIPLWRYEFDDSVAYRIAGDDRVRRILGSHLVYAAGASQKITSGPLRGRTQQGIGVGEVKLPGDDASGYVKYLKRDELVVFDRGGAIKIEVDAIQDESEIRQALAEQVTANQWVLDDDATNVLEAKLKKGPPQTVQYISGSQSPALGPFGPRNPGLRPPPIFGPRTVPGFDDPSSILGGARQPAPPRIESVTIEPFISSILLSIKGQPAWVAASISGVPPTIRLREGESAQQKVLEGQTPDITFFSRAKVPEVIINPAFRAGLGTSVITNRGLAKKKEAQE